MPRGVYERKKEEVITQPQTTETPIQNVPRGTTTRIRKYSTNKDHKGEGEPLCFNCEHRSDMHYPEHRWTETRMARNLQGDMGQIEILNRKPIYDGARPCNHACKCTAYD